MARFAARTSISKLMHQKYVADNWIHAMIHGHFIATIIIIDLL